MRSNYDKVLGKGSTRGRGTVATNVKIAELLATSIGWSEWKGKYHPIKNHFGSDPHQDSFETYGEEWEFVKSQDPKYVWTWIQGDMCELIIAGYHHDGRLGYYITELPWEDEHRYALLSAEVECECYDEETGEGKEDCDECEGWGYVTKHLE